MNFHAYQHAVSVYRDALREERDFDELDALYARIEEARDELELPEHSLWSSRHRVHRRSHTWLGREEVAARLAVIAKKQWGPTQNRKARRQASKVWNFGIPYPILMGHGPQRVLVQHGDYMHRDVAALDAFYAGIRRHQEAARERMTGYIGSIERVIRARDSMRYGYEIHRDVESHIVGLRADRLIVDDPPTPRETRRSLRRAVRGVVTRVMSNLNVNFASMTAEPNLTWVDAR